MKAYPSSLALAVAAALVIAGCGTPIDASTGAVSLKVLSGGDVEVSGRIVAVEQLPKKLESMGAGPRTRIRITVTRATPETVIASITRRLSAAGYRRVVFLRPKTAVSFADEGKP